MRKWIWRDSHEIPLQYMPGKGRLLPGGLPAVAEVVPAGVGLYPEAGGEGGMPVIFDDIADVMSHHSIREIKRKTGLRKSRIYSLRCGCTFHLDYDLVVALKRLGYEIKLEKTSGIPDT